MKVKLILLRVVADLFCKSIGVFYSGAVFHVLLTYIACSYRMDKYYIYSFEDITQNFNKSCLWLDSQTSVSFEAFYVIMH